MIGSRQTPADAEFAKLFREYLEEKDTVDELSLAPEQREKQYAKLDAAYEARNQEFWRKKG